jgi:anti-sigma regulatory factor (Ser/Thr protein kinase)
MAELLNALFPPIPASVRAARSRVHGCLHTHGVDRLADDAALLTSELVTNAVVHARTFVQISIDWDADRLRVQAGDRSPELPHLRPPTGQTQPGGLGLTLIAAIAQRWGFESRGGGKVVWFELDAPHSEDSPER